MTQKEQILKIINEEIENCNKISTEAFNNKKYDEYEKFFEKISELFVIRNRILAEVY